MHALSIAARSFGTQSRHNCRLLQYRSTVARRRKLCEATGRIHLSLKKRGNINLGMSSKTQLEAHAHPRNTMRYLIPSNACRVFVDGLEIQICQRYPT